MSQVQKCKQMQANGESIREISRQLEISRNTVRRYLRGAIPGRYAPRKAQVQPAQDRVREEVVKLLTDERDRVVPRKQRLTGARIFRILEKKGFEISERTVRTVVREVKQSLRDPLQHAYLPLEYDPGQDAQVDFFEAEVDKVDEGRVKVHVLLVRACYSKRTFRYASPNQTREALLEGLMRAFEFFGGVFRFVWFDNLTPVVRKVLKGRDRELQKAFESFNAHYGFEAVFCAPGKGNEKGGVENNVRYSRHEGFSPMPSIRDRSDIQVLLDDITSDDWKRVSRGQQSSIGELWKHEEPQLISLPSCRFEAGSLHQLKVTNRSWIQIGTNFYSVPVKLVGQRVTVRNDAEQVVVYDKSTEVARHDRCYGREMMVLDLDHYLPLLERKHRGVDRAVPVRQWLRDAAQCWSWLLRELRQEQGEVEGSQQFVQCLFLCKTHGANKATEAVESTLASGNVSLATMRYYLGLRREQEQQVPPSISYAGPEVQQGSPEAYMEVLDV